MTSMRKVRRIVSAMLLLLPVTGGAQVFLSGQSAADFVKSSPDETQLAVNGGRPTFGWQSHLFVDGMVNENVGALVNIRVTNTQTVIVDYAAIKLTNLTPLQLSFQAGKFDLPFGNLADRRFPRNNPLYGIPLIYTYATSLKNYVMTRAELLSLRGRGAGMPLLDNGIYADGAMVFGSWGILDYAAAVSAGTVSTASYSGANVNSDLTKTFRVALTPLTGLVIGAGYSWGAYLAESDYVPAWLSNVNEYQQRTAEMDFEFSRGHAVVDGEGVYNVWEAPFQSGDQNLSAFGYTLEGKYTLFPRFYAALRVSGLRFGLIDTGSELDRWDYNVNEWEGGIGYFLYKDVLLKFVRRETRTYGGSRPRDGLTAVQLVVAY